MAGKGDLLESQVKILFGELLKECGFTVLKNRKQKSGTQDGNDNEIIIVDSYKRRFSIHIECKDYSTKLNYSEAVVKIPQIVSSYKPDLMLFLSPKVPFSNPYNDTRLEDFYNKFNTPIEFLTPDNNVEELFALNPNIYKLVYSKELDFKVDRKEKLKWFSDFIFSTKPLQKNVLKGEDRNSYITNINKVDKYIVRECFEASKANKLNYWYSNEGDTFYNKVIQFLNAKNDVEDKIEGLVLLGNPGEGKSTELKHLAIDLWEQKDDLNWIPFFREINTFTQNDQIINYLPKDWEKIPQLIIILDGLDEVANSVAFRSKLEKFIQDNSKSNTIKFVISCRSNIYASVVKSITSFEPYVLKIIPVYQIINHLEEFSELTQEHSIILQQMGSILELLSNPYYLTIFSENYKLDKQLPKNKSDLMERFVERRLKDDIVKFKNSDYDVEKVQLNCKKIALTLESMKENEIKTTALHALIGNDITRFTESSFSKKIYNKELWKFEHRNLQEYFAAKALFQLDLEKIISFIQIDSQITKTHPSWLNSISYLISVFPENNNTLIDWLKENDPEVLLKADKGRIPKGIAIDVFKNYFNQNCKEDKLWIKNYGITAKDLASFANYHEIIEFLMQEILEVSNHRRTRISALQILSFMDILSYQEEVKKLILDMLREPKESIDILFKGEIVSFVKNFGFHKENLFLDQVISSLSKIDSGNILKEILSLIETVNADEYFDYVKKISSKILDKLQRLYSTNDNIDYREDEALARVFLKFEKADHIIFVLSKTPYFDSLFHSERQTKFKALIEKLILLYPEYKKIPFQLLNLVDTDEYQKIITYEFESLFFSFFERTMTENIAFEYFFKEKDKFERNRLYLVHCIKEKNISSIITAYKSGLISQESIIYFRNSLSYNNSLDLSILLEQTLENKTDIKFEQKISKQEREAWTDYHKNKSQKSFDLLFEKKELLDLVEGYFDFAKSDVLTYEICHKLRNKVDRNLEYSKKYRDSFLNLIHSNLMEKEGTIQKNDLIVYIENDLNLYAAIKNKLTDFFRKEPVFSNSQKKQVKKWCLENHKLADFSKIHIQNYKDGNKLRCELIWYFRAYLNLEFPKEILLDLLLIDDRLKSNQKNIGFDYIKNVLPISEINERVIYNIKNESLSQTIYKEHLIHCIENEIDSCYPIVEDYLKDTSNFISFRSSVLYAYIQKKVNIPFLKSFVKPHPTDDMKDDLTWDAVLLLITFNENDFIIDKLTSFLKENRDTPNKFIFIKFLIRANYENAFELFNKWLIEDLESLSNINRHLDSDDYRAHTNDKSLPDLIQLLYIVSRNNTLGKRFMLNPINTAQNTIENICENKGPEFCLKTLDLLENLKQKLILEKIDIFQVSHTIRSVLDIYHNHKSKPYTFPAIAKEIKELEYYFI